MHWNWDFTIFMFPWQLCNCFNKLPAFKWCRCNVFIWLVTLKQSYNTCSFNNLINNSISLGLVMSAPWRLNYFVKIFCEKRDNCGIPPACLIYSFNCTHITVCNTGDIQLVGSGVNASNGTVQLCYNHTWGSVCDNGWDTNDATVVCHQLGYNGMISLGCVYRQKGEFGFYFPRCFSCLH